MNQSLTNNSTQKLPETLEEQREYYLSLFEKWKNWKTSEEIKTSNPKMWELLQEVDFEDKENFLKNTLFTITFCKLANSDFEIQQILIFPKLLYPSFSQINFSKPIIFLGLNQYFNLQEYYTIYFFEVTGNLNLINQNPNNPNQNKVEFKNSNFTNVTLENFDRGYFSPETNKYLNEMEIEGRLTLINCTWSGLPVVREGLDIEEIGQKIWEKKIILDEKNKPLKTLLHKHLAFFSDFVELTEGKKVQIRITSQTQIILVEIFSFNGATAELIERKYYEFIEYSLSDDKDTSKINFSDKIDLITKFKNEGTIGFAKGIFIGEKNHIEDLQKDKFEWQELAKNLTNLSSVLAQKIPEYDSSKLNFNFHLAQNQQNHNSNNMSSYNLNNSANNNSGNINIGDNNQIIDNKISEILAKNQDLELRPVLLEIKEFKNQLLATTNLTQEIKEEALEYIEEIVENIDQNDEPEKIKKLKRASKLLASILGNISLGLATNAGWEIVIKPYLKSKFGINF